MMNTYKQRTLLLVIFVCLLGGVGLISLRNAAANNAATSPEATGRILMFVAYNDVWWAEYKVLYEALIAAGYEVDVRSSRSGSAYTYGNAINDTPPAPSYSSPVSYDEFRTHFENNFGTPWDGSWNTPQPIPLDGRIQDVTNLSEYDALVMPGGTGTVAYRYDGTYAALANWDGTHVTSAAEVQQAAQTLNALMNEALRAGKPVVAICHGAPLAAFARVEGTAGQGFDGLGRSILQGGYATGYALADGDTAARYADLGVTYVYPERLIVDGPEAASFNGNGNGRDLVITSTDWYPETVSYVARTLVNILESYPTPSERTQALDVLVYGGDGKNPFGLSDPLRYIDLATLLNDGSDDLNITAVPTSDFNALHYDNLQNYDVLFFFGHDGAGSPNPIPTGIPEYIQQEIRQYVDNGGGLVGIHHALYNQGKGVLMDVFGASFPVSGWPSQVDYPASNQMININLGHYITTHDVPYAPNSVGYWSPFNSLPNHNWDNDSQRGYYNFTIENDEVYTGINFHFEDGIVFGSEQNEVNRLFSLLHNGTSYDTQAWTRLYNQDGNEQVGRVVYLQPGETTGQTLAHPGYQQVIKNAIVWAALGSDISLPPPTPTPTPIPIDYTDFLYMPVIVAR